MQPDKQEPLKAPLSVEDSRAKRHQRQQSRFRDRGGIFVPTNRTSLIGILLRQKSSSPKKLVQSTSASPRKRDTTSSRNHDTRSKSNRSLRVLGNRVESQKKSPVYARSQITVTNHPSGEGANDDITTETKNASANGVRNQIKSREIVEKQLARKKSAKRRRPPPKLESLQSTIEGQGVGEDMPVDKLKRASKSVQKRFIVHLDSEDELPLPLKVHPTSRSKGSRREAKCKSEGNTLTVITEYLLPKTIIHGREPGERTISHDKMPEEEKLREVERDKSYDARRPSQSNAKGTHSNKDAIPSKSTSRKRQRTPKQGEKKSKDKRTTISQQSKGAEASIQKDDCDGDRRSQSKKRLRGLDTDTTTSPKRPKTSAKYSEGGSPADNQGVTRTKIKGVAVKTKPIAKVRIPRSKKDRLDNIIPPFVKLKPRKSVLQRIKQPLPPTEDDTPDPINFLS